MLGNGVDALLLGAAGLLWLILGIFPQPLWIIWQTVCERQQLDPQPTARFQRNARVLAFSMALLLGIAAWLSQ